MGGIGVWGMHFVGMDSLFVSAQPTISSLLHNITKGFVPNLLTSTGNRAVVLAHGARERQIMYNPTYTAISFFMPIVVLFCAFYVLGVRRRTHLHLAGVAILTGAAICGMHYLGQYGIANYQCSYQVGNVVGAAIIAVAASFIALSLFFRLRDTWTDSWWKRTFCGVILAMAVSGMHWTATVGTSYEWKNNDTIRGSSRTQTSIIAATLV
jgi:NO-binding membrane sensor protein with MHYT domain